MAEAPRRAAPHALSAGFVVSYAVFWAVGLGFLWWIAALVRALFRPPVSRRVQWLPVVAITLLGASLVVSCAGGDVEVSRVAASLYNMSIWIAVLALATRHLDVDEFVTGLAFLGAIQSLLTVVAYLYYPTFYRLPLLASYVLPDSFDNDAAFGNFLYARLVQEDYFGEVVLRTGGFLGNPTWGASLTAMSMVASGIVVHRRLRSHRTGWTTWVLAVGTCLSAFCLYTSYSRNTWIALAIGLAGAAIVSLRRRLGLNAVASASLLGLAGVIVFLAKVNLDALFADFNDVRAGSLSSRTAIYRATWDALMALPTPVLGAGIKERVPYLVASLGTHSSYLGILYRGGWIAGTCFALWMGTLLVRSWRQSDALAFGSVLYAAFWYIAEDFDAGNLTAIAVVLALYRTISWRNVGPIPCVRCSGRPGRGAREAIGVGDERAAEVAGPGRLRDDRRPPAQEPGPGVRAGG